MRVPDGSAMIRSMTDQQSPATLPKLHPLGSRVARAAGVGAGLALVALFGGGMIVAVLPCRSAGWGCLGFYLQVGAVVLVMVAVLAWPLLYLVNVRPAILVALGGPAASTVIGWFGYQVIHYVPFKTAGMLASAALGYGAAALVTARELGWTWRIAVGAALAALIPLASVQATADRTDRSAAADRYFEEQLRSVGMPLLAPDLPEYLATDAHADPTDRAFSYSLVPRALPTQASDYDRATATIVVSVQLVPTRFTPPTRCNSSDLDNPDHPCAQVGPLIWRQPLEGPTVQYLTRRDSVLIVVSQTGDHINEDVLRKAVQTLTLQPPSHFSRGGY